MAINLNPSVTAIKDSLSTRVLLVRISPMLQQLDGNLHHAGDNLWRGDQGAVGGRNVE